MSHAPLILALAMVGATPSAAVAQESPSRPSPAYDRCMATGEAARGNVTAISVCVGTEQAVQGQRLDDAYDRAMNRLGLWYQVDLHNQQAQWRADRDSRCTTRAGSDRRGNASAPAYAQCMLDETIARAAWLETYSPE